MAHPFAKIFETGLKKSTPLDNVVLTEAEKLREKGYSASEIYAVLLKFKHGRIDDADTEIIEEAVEEFERYME